MHTPKLGVAELDELEASLISSDLGPNITTSLLTQLKTDLANGLELGQGQLVETLKLKVLDVFGQASPEDLELKPTKHGSGPQIIMIVGVNGVGKTTTVAKLAHRLKEQGASVVIAAADTFRAAAVEQLTAWANRVGVPVITGAVDAKPATVVFDATKKAVELGADILLIDTAGRLHTKSNLMQELEGVRNAVQRHIPDGPHETLLVVDGSTGQNAISQAREFNQAVKLSGLIVTKLDGTPKGGVVVAIKSELGIPVRYIGVGESEGDLRPFSAHEFVEALFNTDCEPEVTASAHGETRRRKRREVEASI